MAFAPSAFWNSRSITHLANYLSPSLPMNSSDESLLKADTQRDRKRATDDADHRDAVIVLDVFAQLFADLMFHRSFHTTGTTTGEGTADFDAIGSRDHQAARP